MLRTAVAASALLSLSAALPTSSSHTSGSTAIDWQPCNLDFPAAVETAIEAHGDTVYCAILTVPLDYTESSEGETLDLQLVRIKATKEPFKGSILTNPGGPGGSGVDWIAVDGPSIRDDLGGYHDVVGFDPRGTGRTLPYSCVSATNSSSKVKRNEYNFTIPQDNVYPSLEEDAWNDGGIFVAECNALNSDIGAYLGTTFVARDMLEIIDALGEEQLQYWGISYGTVLGQTFAGMFPNRVGRIVLDSTLRFDDYWAGHWQTVTRDTERAIVNFFNECVKAGPEICPLANFTGPKTTAEDLHLALADVLQELLDDPIYLPETYQPSPWWQPGTNIPLYRELKYVLLALAYRPNQFAQLYYYVDIALQRDWTTLIETYAAPATNSSAPAPIPWNLGANAFHGITCGDGAFRASAPQDLYSLVQSQQSAGAFGDTFGPQIWPCAQWPVSAKERYEGPFTAINTSYPILFIQGNHDPITPLSGAYEASSNFPGSRIMVQNGHGHGVRNHPSDCTNEVVARYFGEGELPEVGKVCQTNKSAYEVFLDFVLAQTGNATIAGGGVEKRNLEDVKRSLL